jgi:hypothetical protein
VDKFSAITQTLQLIPGFPNKIYAGFTAQFLSRYYVFGGHDANGVGGNLYQFKTEVWSTKTASSYTRALGASLLFSDRAYWIGGRDSSDTKQGFTLKMDSTETISVASSLNVTAYFACTGCSNGENGYSIGGYDGSNFVSSIYKFSRSTETVQVSSTSLSPTRYNISQCYDKKVSYLSGGATGTGSATGMEGGLNSTADFQKFDMTTQTLSAASTNLSYTITGAASTRIVSVGYLFGGMTPGPVRNLAKSAVYTIDFTNNGARAKIGDLNLARGMSAPLFRPI